MDIVLLSFSAQMLGEANSDFRGQNEYPSCDPERFQEAHRHPRLPPWPRRHRDIIKAIISNRHSGIYIMQKTMVRGGGEMASRGKK